MQSNAVGNPKNQVQFLRSRFQELYGGLPRTFRAPGRVNLIGEHTDYNDGFVMPAAIEFYTWVAAAPRADRVLRAWSEQFQETAEFSLDDLSGPPRKHWSDYIRGVAAVLQSSGHRLCGADLLVDGHVPLGAGLSSSAAIELSTALALTAIAGQAVPRMELVKLSQRAEHEYSGTLCGIMDQFISGFGHAGSALMLDCRSLDYKLLPIGSDVRLVICNSMVKHQLAAGEYNLRRSECEAGVAALRKFLPQVRALRDVSLDDLQKHRASLSNDVYRRCHHVITENNRVLRAAAALEAGDMVRFGELMYASHASLRDDYQVSCAELDALVEAASSCDGVYGARMTGGGFGGCTVNLVRADAVERFQERVSEQYRRATGITPVIFTTSAAEGASVVEESGSAE